MIGPASSRSGGRDQRQQQVLDHVQREQRRVVARRCRSASANRTAITPAPRSDRPPALDGVAGMRPVDAADAHEPQQQGDDRGQPGPAGRTTSRREGREVVGGSDGAPPWARTAGRASERDDGRDGDRERRAHGRPAACGPGRARRRSTRRILSPRHESAARRAPAPPHARSSGMIDTRPATRHGCARPGRTRPPSRLRPRHAAAASFEEPRCRCPPGHGPRPARSSPASCCRHRRRSS